MREGQSEDRDRYTHGHSEVVASYMGQRTAASHAAFLTPHLASGMSLLDCGCGPGTITLGLANVVAPGEVIGIDFAESQIEQARANAVESAVANVTFQIGDAYDMPFPDGCFDAVFSHTLLEHLAEPQKAIAEMHRVIKSGGVMGVTETDRGSNVFWPDGHPALRYFRLLADLVKHNGGDPFGRRLRSSLIQAGFVSVSASASYESRGTPESVRAYTDVGVSYILNTFGPQAVELSWVTESEIRSMAADFQYLGSAPDAFLATTLCHSVGWKQ